MQIYGRLPSGEEIYRFVLKSECATAEIISYGARLASFRPFGREIIAGFGSLEAYMNDRSFHGATVGRVCNRIVGASFVMDGVRYELTRNNGDNCLHGGADNFSDKAWEVISQDGGYVKLGYTSPDGQSGFPGEVRVYAEYSLEGAALCVRYTAVPTKKTPIMITNHAYFNLAGFGSEVLEHSLRIWADEYSEVSEQRLPTGRHADVSLTAVDFREAHEIGERINDSPIGYDHSFVLSPSAWREALGGRVGLAAEVKCGDLMLRAYTDQPGMQLYVPLGAVKQPLRDGAMQVALGAFCLEAQIEPNAVALGRSFVEAGESYVSTTVYEASLS